MARYDVEATGTERAASRLFKVAERAADARPAFKDIADVLREGERDLFSREGGGLWAALRPGTISKRRRKGQGTKILDATGGLMRSLTVKGAKGAVQRVSKTMLVLGSRVFYAKFQKKNRPPLIVNAAHEQTSVTKMMDWLTGE